MIKRLKQINVIGQICYLVCAAILIWMNFGLIAIVSAQLLSVLIIRFFSYRSFYDVEITKKLQAKEVLRKIYLALSSLML
jgi:hypothetical protein